MKLLAVAHISSESASCVISVACRNLSPIRAEGHRVHPANESQSMKLLAARSIPNASAITAARHNLGPIRAERHGVHDAHQRIVI